MALDITRPELFAPGEGLPVSFGDCVVQGYKISKCIRIYGSTFGVKIEKYVITELACNLPL